MRHPSTRNILCVASTAEALTHCYAYELWERVYNERYTWVGDKYGNNGYIGPDTWFTTEPWSSPIEHRYTQVDLPPTTPTPGA